MRNCGRHTKFDIQFTYAPPWTVNEQGSCFESPEIHRVIYNKSTSIMEKHRTTYDKRALIMEKLGSFMRKSPLSWKTWVVYKKKHPYRGKGLLYWFSCWYYNYEIFIIKPFCILYWQNIVIFTGCIEHWLEKRYIIL